MDYRRIVSVTGLSGLFELVSSKNDGAIVKSLEDKSVKFVSSRTSNFSHLESIEVYTTSNNINLVEVFKAMGESDEKLPSEKDATAIKKYFKKIMPNLDYDRVYASDMKKMLKWFNIIKNNNINIHFNKEEESVESEA